MPRIIVSHLMILLAAGSCGAADIRLSDLSTLLSRCNVLASLVPPVGESTELQRSYLSDLLDEISVTDSDKDLIRSYRNAIVALGNNQNKGSTSHRIVNAVARATVIARVECVELFFDSSQGSKRLSDAIDLLAEYQKMLVSLEKTHGVDIRRANEDEFSIANWYLYDELLYSLPVIRFAVEYSESKSPVDVEGDFKDSLDDLEQDATKAAQTDQEKMTDFIGKIVSAGKVEEQRHKLIRHQLLATEIALFRHICMAKVIADHTQAYESSIDIASNGDMAFEKAAEYIHSISTSDEIANLDADDLYTPLEAVIWRRFVSNILGPEDITKLHEDVQAFERALKDSPTQSVYDAYPNRAVHPTRYGVIPYSLDYWLTLSDGEERYLDFKTYLLNGESKSRGALLLKPFADSLDSVFSRALAR